jgi:filamentous hemagglutinin family protein
MMNEEGKGELWITLTTEQRQMSGFQFDLTLPEGMAIADEGITIGSHKHNAWCESMGANDYRIVCASLSNAAFTSDTVMCVKIRATGMKQGSYDLSATDIVLSDTQAKRYESQAIRERVEVEGQDEGLQMSVNGGALTLTARGKQQVFIIQPNGIQVHAFELIDGATAIRVLPQGLYIVNGKKVIL